MAKILQILCRAQNVVYNVISISGCELVGLSHLLIFFERKLMATASGMMLMARKPKTARTWPKSHP